MVYRCAAMQDFVWCVMWCSADPWLGRRGSLLASFGAGCGELDRTDPRDRHLGGGLRSMCASAQARIICARPSMDARRQWRPLVLVLAAAYLLFSNDQGRELGLSLMAEKVVANFLLFLALIYWATNNGIRRGRASGAARLARRCAAWPTSRFLRAMKNGFSGRRAFLASARIFSPRSIFL